MSDVARTTPRPSVDHARIVLAGVLPNNIERLYHAQSHIDEGHISGTELKILFMLCCRYVERIGHFPSVESLVDLLGSEYDSGKVLHYKTLYESLVEQDVGEGDFKWSVQQLREIRAERETAEILATALNIARDSVQVDKTVLSGHLEARSYAMKGFSDIETALQQQDAPEGSVHLEEEQMVADYEEAKARRMAGRSMGVQTGLEPLDNMTGGLQEGELSLIIGFTSEGKTGLAVQTAWHASVMQGLNVFFATSETLRAQVRRKIIARHSMLPKFELQSGLNTRDLKSGSLSGNDETTLQRVIRDLTHSPEYGKLHLAQIPRGSTVDSLASRLHAANAWWRIDLVVIDYIPLLLPARHRQSSQAEMADTVKSAKILAASFDEGRGVPILSPWQVSRAAWELANKTGGYTLAALSDTSEAEKSSDLIISLLRPQESAMNRRSEITLQVLKNRDGERLEGTQIQADFATCCYTAERPDEGVSSLDDDLFGDDLMGGAEFDSLL